MGQTIKAPLLYRQREPMGVEDIEVEDPQEGEVKVKMTASGVCHSCLHAADGSWTRFDDAMPMVLGDEGSGVVEEVGAGVHSVEPGDHVVLSWSPSCGLCRHCVVGKPALCLNRATVGRILGGHTRFRWQGKPAYHFGATGTYAPVTVIHHSQAIKIDDDVPLETAALIGCSVTTGVGAVLNTAQVPAGAPIAVWGAGGIGLNVIQGGVVCGAWPIIAVDIDSRKLGLAEEFGATHVVDASKEDPVEAVTRITDGGADYTFVAVGHMPAAEQAWNALAKGGLCVVIGLGPTGGKVAVDNFDLITKERRLAGSFYGTAQPRNDFPRFVNLYKAGKLKLDELVTKRYSIYEANEAFEDLKAGQLARGLIVF